VTVDTARASPGAPSLIAMTTTEKHQRGTRLAALMAATLLASLFAPVGRPQAAQPPVPRLNWSACPDAAELQCATAHVPLDHGNPSGGRIVLPLIKVPASSPDQRIGVLVLHRGGPGFSTVDYVKLLHAHQLPNPLSSQVWARYDVIGVDQRGVGHSSPAVRCFESKAKQREFSAGMPAFPVTAEQQRQRAVKDAEYAQRCRKLSGKLLDHVTTAEAVQDLDLIRAALGEPRLNFLGQSYGSYLGSVYANMFPNRVGRFVFDSVVDPVRQTSGASGTIASARTGSDVASTATLDEFFRLCAEAGPNCPFGDGDPQAAFQRLAERLRAAPLRLTASDGRTVVVSYNIIIALAGGLLYQPGLGFWEVLATTLQQTEQVIAEPDGPFAANYAAGLLDTIDAGFGGLPHDAPEGQAFHAVHCTDVENPDDPQAWARIAERREPIAPHFATLRAYESSPCAAWRGHGAARYTGPWDAATVEPVLIVNSRFDPATPVESAIRLQATLPNSRLLINEGWGHVTTQQSSCAVDAISAYLVAGRLPANGATCRPDRVPFSAP